MSIFDYSPLGSMLGLGSKRAPTALDAAGQAQVASAADKSRQNKLFDENNTNLDWITGGAGGPTSSPLYKSFLTKSRTATANSYDNAITNARAGAGARGFGYASPNEETAELGVRGAEASQLGQAPSTALQQTMPYDMQAMGLRAQEAGTYGGESLAEGGMWNEDILQHDKNKQANQSALYNGLSSIAGSMIMAGG